MRFAHPSRFIPLLLASVAAVAPAWSEVPAAASPAVVVPAEPALTPAAAVIRDGLPAALAALPEGERAAVAGFYAARGYAPFWTDEESGRIGTLVAALGASADQALPAARHDPAALDAAFVAGGGADAAGLEAAAMRAYLGYGADMAGGVLTPSAVDEEIARKRIVPSADVLLGGLVAGNVSEALQALEPASPDYRLLLAEKDRLETLARTEAWGPQVSDGPTLHPGETDVRVAELRGRMARLGYLAPGAGTPGDLFDPALAAAVESFQRDNGLTDDGAVGARTLAALNAPAVSRLAQVMVNIERVRWMNHDLGGRYLYVNIPDFTVRLIDGGAETWQSKVVTGLAHKTETPEFSGLVRYMVVNPTWHIPNSIAIRDYLPKLQRDPMVLKRQNIDLMTRGGTIINPKLVDFRQYTPENFPFRIKQRPNDDNALGIVKFMFPNEFSVYMHDTPHRELFARDIRAFSNGCVRLQKPAELAAILLTGQVPDPEASFDGWVAAKSERTVNLERSIPVHIDYRTVWFEQDGTARFRPDVYDRDRKVFEALEAAGVTLPAAQG